VVIGEQSDNHLISLGFLTNRRILIPEGFVQLGIVKGDAAVLADQDKALEAPVLALRALNDNDIADIRPSLPELFYLRRGLIQPGGKLPLFDLDGQTIAPEVVQACLDRGWAEPWFNNPLKPDWLVCKLTEAGRRLAASA
jgi:hypothetical protein